MLQEVDSRPILSYNCNRRANDLPISLGLDGHSACHRLIGGASVTRHPAPVALAACCHHGAACTPRAPDRRLVGPRMGGTTLPVRIEA